MIALAPLLLTADSVSQFKADENVQVTGQGKEQESCSVLDQRLGYHAIYIENLPEMEHSQLRTAEDH